MDFTIHFWPAISYFGSFCTFLYYTRKIFLSIRQLVVAAETLLKEHQEVYGWYSDTIRNKGRVDHGNTKAISQGAGHDG